jgi:hypothetical protein
VAGFLNLGIVLLYAAGLVMAVRRLGRQDEDRRASAGTRWIHLRSRARRRP